MLYWKKKTDTCTLVFPALFIDLIVKAVIAAGAACSSLHI